MISVCAVAQHSFHVTIAHLTILAVDTHLGICRVHSHHQIVHSGGGRLLLSGCRRERQGDDVGHLRQQGVDAVVCEVYHHRQERARFYLEHLRAAEHIYPVVAGLVLDGLNYIPEKLHIVGQYLHAHQGARLSIVVKARILACRKVGGCHLHAFHSSLLRQERRYRQHPRGNHQHYAVHHM